MTQYLWLLPVGVLIGAFGTLIGAGGGFVLTPMLLLVDVAVGRPDGSG